MRPTYFSWPAIRKDLLRSAATAGFRRDFQGIRSRSGPLARYNDSSALLCALHEQGETPEAKNLVLTTLVEAAQSSRPEAACALTLLLLALWPGLDAVRWRLRRRGSGKLEELTSDILVGAIEAIRRLDLRRVSRVAATVLRNIERDLVRASRRDIAQRLCLDDRDPDELGRDPGSSWEQLRAELDRVLGADAGLVFNVAVEGFSQSAMAVQFGISEAATRKRYQRATLRLRQTLQVA
jgi:DNA-directed RNA polymerase specialized sigma24 family protein